MRKKAVFIISLILIFAIIVLKSSGSRNNLIRSFHEVALKFVPEKNIPGETAHPHLIRQLDRYLPLVVKFELISKVHMPLEHEIHQALLDSMGIKPDSVLNFIRQLDSLNTSEIKLFYQKFQTVLDTTKMPDSIRVKIRKEFQNKIRNPILPGGKP